MRSRVVTVAAVAMTLSVLVLVLGCSNNPGETPGLSVVGTPSPTMSAIPGSSESASPGASPTASSPPVASTTPPTAVLRADSLADVVTDGLLVRTKPSVASDSKKLAPLLRRRSRVYVVAGPTRASSYNWYLVRPLDGSFPSGWVAASDHDGTPWLASADIVCPGSPGLRDLGRMDRFLALACYGAREFRFDGMLTSTVASCDGSLSTDPSWLDDCYAAPYLAPDKGAGNPGLDGSPAIELRIPPDVERRAAIPYQPNGMLIPVRVAGHFDDPRAASCRTNGGEGAAAPPPTIYTLVCRAEFVATTVELLTGPDMIPLPAPVLAEAGTEPYSNGSNTGTRVLLDVTNWESYPGELFASAPDLLPCGLNDDAARTWVEISDVTDSTDPYDIYGFCALREPRDMLGLWFAVPSGSTPPAKVNVTLTDRRTGRQVRSNTVILAPIR